MFKILIEKEEPNRPGVVEFLRYVADQIEKNFSSGMGWDLEGDDDFEYGDREDSHVPEDEEEGELKDKK